MTDTERRIADADTSLRGFLSDDLLLAEVAATIERTYDGTDYLRPDVGDVIADALEVVRENVGDLAEDGADCSKVDSCAATAVVFRRLAEWLDATP